MPWPEVQSEVVQAAAGFHNPVSKSFLPVPDLVLKQFDTASHHLWHARPNPNLGNEAIDFLAFRGQFFASWFLSGLDDDDTCDGEPLKACILEQDAALRIGRSLDLHGPPIPWLDDIIEAIDAVIGGSTRNVIRGSLMVSLGLLGLSLLAKPFWPKLKIVNVQRVVVWGIAIQAYLLIAPAIYANLESMRHSKQLNAALALVCKMSVSQH